MQVRTAEKIASYCINTAKSWYKSAWKWNANIGDARKSPKLRGKVQRKPSVLRLANLYMLCYTVHENEEETRHRKKKFRKGAFL